MACLYAFMSGHASASNECGEHAFFYNACSNKRESVMKKKNVRYSEADLLSMEAMRLEQRRVRRELSLLRKELQDFKTFYPLIENIIETSIKIIRSRKIG